MNEHSFVQAVHRRLKRTTDRIDIWKINDNYAGGVPDAVYFGDKDVFWVEYKYLKQLPKRESTVIDLTRSTQYLSSLQQQWLEQKHLKNISAAVIVGSPVGHMVFPDLSWKIPISVASFTTNALTTDKIAHFIIKKVLH